MGVRSKEILVMEFIQTMDLTQQFQPEEVVEAFYTFTRQKKQDAMKEVVQTHRLKEEGLMYIHKAIQRGYASMEGTEIRCHLTTNF